MLHCLILHIAAMFNTKPPYTRQTSSLNHIPTPADPHLLQDATCVVSGPSIVTR